MSTSIIIFGAILTIINLILLYKQPQGRKKEIDELKNELEMLQEQIIINLETQIKIDGIIQRQLHLVEKQVSATRKHVDDSLLTLKIRKIINDMEQQ